MVTNNESGCFKGRNGKALLASLIVLVIVAIGFIVYGVIASGTIARDDREISSLNNEISSNKTQITSLQSQLNSTQSQLTSANNQSSSLQTQVSALQGQVTSLQGQVSDLQSIVKLSKSTDKRTQYTINQASKQSTEVVTFVAEYAGYVVISGTTTTGNGYIRVTDTFYDYPLNSYFYQFGTQDNLLVPVLPGTVTVIFGNNNQDFIGATATLSVTYHY